MKNFILSIVLLLLSFTLFAQSKQTHVRTYQKKNGTVVPHHDRTASNKTQRDNWSTKGNTNPETGKRGTKKAKK